MIILGIDPGYDRLGIAVIEKSAGMREQVLHSDCFQTSSKDPIYERFQRIGGEVARLLDRYAPDALAIETLFITKNQKTAMRVSEARGIVIYEAGKHGVPVYEYGPMEIKMAVTGDGSSDKDRIIRMVHMLVSVPDKKTVDDEYDALAVALTCSATLSTRVRSRPSGTLPA